MLSMCLIVKSVSEIDPFLLNHQRAFEYLRVNRPYVFSKDSDEEELHRGKEEEAYHHRRGPNRKVLPEEEFVDQIADCHK